MSPTSDTRTDATEAPVGVPLPERVADVLRESILNGGFKTGDALTEAHLASELRVSRAPIREALRILASEGLVEVIPYKGTTVRKVGRKDIEEVYSLRGQLEAFALERLINADDPVDIAPLETSFARMKALATKGDFAGLSAEDEAFHRTMIALTGHELLASVWDSIAIRMRFIIAMRNRRNPDPMEVALNHVPIIEAIRNRDLDEARTIMTRHVSSAADLIDWVEDGTA